ncbi:MAG: radical SAM protein [Mesorhizobium sp.]|nr:radical SAM protein [Mesorhizobium sp.]
MARVRAAFVAVPIMDQADDGRWVPSLQDADRESPQLGVYLLVGSLERDGRDVDLYDWVGHPEWSLDWLVETLAGYDVLFFSCNSMNWSVVRRLARDLRARRGDQRFCVGGPHATHYPESVSKSGLFDLFYRGEADRYIARIYDMLASGNLQAAGEIPGLGSRAVPEPAINQEADLSQLEWTPAYDRLPDKAFLTLPVETSRGCKFQCTFCSIPAKKNWRGYGADFAIGQIELANRYANKTRSGRISIVDDTFTTDHARIHGIMSGLDRGVFGRRLVFDATVVDLLDRDLVDHIKPFTSDLLVGAEVSTKKDAKHIRKAATPELVRRAARNLHDAGIAERAVFSFIIGFPWQNRSDCIEVLRFVKNLIFDFGVRTYVQWYWPMPGSAIWDGLKGAGKVDLAMVDEIGFFRSNEWFFPFRALDFDDVLDIDSKAIVVQALTTIGAEMQRARAIEYASPLEIVRKVNRAPHLVAAHSA